MTVTAELQLVTYSNYLLRADYVGKLHMNRIEIFVSQFQHIVLVE